MKTVLIPIVTASVFYALTFLIAPNHGWTEWGVWMLGWVGSTVTQIAIVITE